jgi:hypothetical protein
MMRDGLAQVLLNRRLAAGAPLLIHTLAGNGLASLGTMAAQLRRQVGDSDVAPGTFLSFWCNDGVVSSTSTAMLRERCRVWLGDAWDGRRADPLHSDIPGLIETGEFDPRTPPSYARLLAAGLPRAHVVTLPWYGHERPPDCSLRIARAFFDAPDDVPDTACLDSIPPIEFVTGVVPSRPVARAVGRTASRPWLAALPGTAALLMLVPAIGIPVREFRARRRGRRPDSPVESVALVLVAAVGLTFLLGFTIAIMTSMRRHFFIPLVGLPEQWTWLLALPWLLLVLTAIAAFLVLRGRSAGSGRVGSPSVLRWCTLLGGIIVLAFWYAQLLA